MNPYSPLAASCLLLCLASGAARAQENNSPFTARSGLGDHIASRVLNMNGYNITNLADPFFEADAVTLGYLNRHSGWDHKAVGDVDFGGNALGNIGGITLDGATVQGGTFDAPAIRHPEITGGTISGISLSNAAIKVPRVTGGSFDAPALLAASIDGATITGSEINEATLRDPTVSGGDLENVSIAAGEAEGISLNGETRVTGTLVLDGVRVSGDMTLDAGRIVGLADAENDLDAMNKRTTLRMIDESLSEIRNIVGGPRPVQSAPPADEGTNPVAVIPPAREPLQNIGHISGDLTVDGNLNIAGLIAGGAAQYRPTPIVADALGYLDGADTLDALLDMKALVYNLPDGTLAAGVDPGTIPQRMEFIIRPVESGSGGASIDYIQMIGPMVAAIQLMDRRIAELEARLRAMK